MIEDELLKWKFKQGSIEALSCIYQKYLDHLLTLAVGLLNDPNEAEDIVQELMVYIWINRDKFFNMENPGPYLYRSVKNRSIN